MAVSIKKILISQPEPTAGKSPYYDIAEKYGAEVLFRPFIKVVPLSSREFRQQKIDVLSHTAIVFTARTAIDHFFAITEELRQPMPDTMKYFCVSESVAVYLQKYIIYRKRKIFFGQTGKLPDLVAVIKKHNKEKYFIPVAEEHSEELMTMLKGIKTSFQKGVMYRTVSNDFAPNESLDHDLIIFFSPSGIAALKKNFPHFEQGEVRIGAFGPSTSQAVADAGLRLDLMAPTPESPSMAQALDQYLALEAKK